jgi:hypothetical protein
MILCRSAPNHRLERPTYDRLTMFRQQRAPAAQPERWAAIQLQNTTNQREKSLCLTQP